MKARAWILTFEVPAWEQLFVDSASARGVKAQVWELPVVVSVLMQAARASPLGHFFVPIGTCSRWTD